MLFHRERTISMTQKSLMFLLVAGAAAVAGFAQTTATATGVTASTVIYVPITINKIADLSFGDVFPGSVAGTVALDPVTGTATPTGTGVSLGIAAHAAAPASFSMTGKKNATFSLTLPSTVSMSGPGPAIEVNSITCAVGAGSTMTGPTFTGALSALGDQNVKVGGTMAISTAALQTEGAYSGTFNVTVTYN